MNSSRIEPSVQAMKRRELRLLAAAVLVFASAVACSSATISAGGPGADLDAGADAAAAPPSPLPPGACPTPVAPPATDSACTLPSELASGTLTDAWVTTSPACATKLYLALGSADVLRRYDVKSASPCVIERDTSFPEVPVVLGGDDYVTADDAGNVFHANGAGTSRVAPGPAVVCSAQGLNLTDFFARAATLRPDGSVGYVGYARSENGFVVEAKIAKLTTTSSGCSLAPFVLTGGTPITGINNLAIDPKGRLHVADDAYGPAGHRRVVIYDASGVFVSTYDTGVDGEPFLSAADITPCQGGLCVDAFSSIVAVDDDGNFRGGSPYHNSKGVSGPILRGTVDGPLFVLGSISPGTGVSVDVLAKR